MKVLHLCLRLAGMDQIVLRHEPLHVDKGLAYAGGHILSLPTLLVHQLPLEQLSLKNAQVKRVNRVAVTGVINRWRFSFINLKCL